MTLGDRKEGFFYYAEKGDCLSSIAADNGMSWKSIWNHSKNRELREKRGNPNILREGDKIFIPPFEALVLMAKTEADIKIIQVKVEKSQLSFRILEGDIPRKNVNVEVAFSDGKIIKTKSGQDGRILVDVSNSVKNCVLTIVSEFGSERYTLELGDLDPVDEYSGVQQRLNNLGYTLMVSGVLDDETKEALIRFQFDHEIEISGKICPRTKNKILELHC